MAQIIHSNYKKYCYIDGEPPQEEEVKVETLRDKLLKAIVKKQLDTKSNLEQILQRKKCFVAGSTETSITQHIHGISSLSEFKGVNDDVEVEQLLSSCSLSSSEIGLLLSQVQSKCLSDDVEQQKLKEIEKKLESKIKEIENPKAEYFTGAVGLTRKQYEEELALESSRTAQSLTSCLVYLKSTNTGEYNNDHPVNYIKNLAEELFPTNETPAYVPKQKRLKREASPAVMVLDQKPDTFWDMKKIPIVCKSENRIIGCQNKPRNAVQNAVKIPVNCVKPDIKFDCTKPFVWQMKPEDLIPIADIASNRVPMEVIMADQKFRKYSMGSQSSSTLFLKNLPKSLTPRLLVALFGHFERDDCPSIVYRILGGRMRGQAFVSFYDKDTASKALSLINGYKIEGKPLLIEYGRR